MVSGGEHATDEPRTGETPGGSDVPAKIPSERYAEVFWSKVEKTATCWLWKGSKKSGKWPYGNVRYQGRIDVAHRVAWILTHGSIPKDIMVLHNCPGKDNPACVNPDHLFLGTLKENTQDAIKKGKYKEQHEGCRERCGEKNPLAKLTTQQVIEARKRAAQGESYAAIARSLNVSDSNISRIVREETWQHVRGP
jgi:HNH endonuclease/CENP-B-like protein